MIIMLNSSFFVVRGSKMILEKVTMAQQRPPPQQRKCPSVLMSNMKRNPRRILHTFQVARAVPRTSITAMTTQTASISLKKAMTMGKRMIPNNIEMQTFEKPSIFFCLTGTRRVCYHWMRIWKRWAQLHLAAGDTTGLFILTWAVTVTYQVDSFTTTATNYL